MKNAAESAQLFIEKIKSGKIRKEILMNSSLDFSGNGENDALKRYEAYLRSLSYEMNTKFESVVYNG